MVNKPLIELENIIRFELTGISILLQLSWLKMQTALLLTG